MRTLILLTAAAALAACSAESETDLPADTPADTEVVEGGVEQGEVPARPLRPGLWEIAESVADVDAPPLRDREVAEMEDAPGAAARTLCLPDDYADRPHPDFWAGEGNACAYEEFAMIGGELEGRLSCNATPGTLTLAFDGEYDATRFDLAMTAARSGEGADTAVEGRVRGRWLRACEADERVR